VIKNSCLQEAKRELNRTDLNPNSHAKHEQVKTSSEEEEDGWARAAGQPKLLQPEDRPRQLEPTVQLLARLK